MNHEEEMELGREQAATGKIQLPFEPHPMSQRDQEIASLQLGIAKLDDKISRLTEKIGRLMHTLDS